MFELQTVHRPFDQHIITVDKIPMAVEKNTDIEIEAARKIVNDFLYHSICDTLVTTTPETIFRYNIPPILDSKDIVLILDNTMYTLFNKNIYATPYISFSKPSCEENLQNDIVIDAKDTIETINTSDKRLNRVLKKYLYQNTEKLKHGESIQFIGLVPSLFELPMVYARSRAKYITDELNKNNYLCKFDESTGYISISYTEEKQ